MSSRKRIVICGGGAIGAAVAHFTSRRRALPIVIERHEVAGAASGKSGGFLALDWCSGSPLDGLARRSFELHAELSSELGDPWGYRRLTTYSGYAAEDDAARGPGARPWLAGPAVWGYKGHSLVFETGETIPAEALFLEYREAPDPRGISARRWHD